MTNCCDQRPFAAINEDAETAKDTSGYIHGAISGQRECFNEEHTLGTLSGVLGGQIVLAGGTSDD